MNIVMATVLAITAYLLGSLSTAIIASKLMGLPDPRTVGSQNPGATNVLRSGNKKAAIITLLGDMLKGLAAVVLAKILGATPLVLAIVALAVFLGHLYPVFFEFKGGKGVATALGVLLGIDWLAGLSCLVIWILTAFISRISSLSALVAALAAPLMVAYFTRSTELVLATTVMTAFLFWRHRGNIAKLLTGHESKIGQK